MLRRALRWLAAGQLKLRDGKVAQQIRMDLITPLPTGGVVLPTEPPDAHARQPPAP